MLITIVVITYNSAPYVLDVLESTYRQTYSNIELIISDDCSTDNTIEICEEWLHSHKERFLHTEITQTPTNGGIAKNYNHALRRVHGEYIKYIAGDDILKDNCIEHFVNNIQKDIYLYFSNAERIDENGKLACYFHSTIPRENNAKKQLKAMLRYHPMVFGPCIFVEKKHLLELGGFDEQYPMSEDYPILMKFLTHGYACKIIEEPLVQWRMHGDSVSASNKYNFKDSVKKSITYYSWRYSWRYGLIFTPYHDWLNLWIPSHYNKGVFYRIFGYLFRAFDLIHLKRKFFGWPKLIEVIDAFD